QRVWAVEGLLTHPQYPSRRNGRYTYDEYESLGADSSSTVRYKPIHATRAESIGCWKAADAPIVTEQTQRMIYTYDVCEG
ncbi:hypothetical protein SARC_17422, partial [Sphaeroforma arctica JP610]